MTRFRLALVTMGAAALLIAAPHADAEPVIELVPGASAITLTADEATTFLLAYEPVAGIEATVVPSVVGVTLDGRPVSIGDGDLEVTNDADLQRLSLTIRTDAFPRSGAYTITLRLQAGDATQFAEITATRADAALAAPAVVDVERTIWLPEVGWGDTDDDIPPVLLRTGADSRVTELTAIATDATSEGIRFGETPAATTALVPTDDLLALGPDALLEIFPGLTDDLPLGTIDRTVELTSPQLGDPVTVTFRITTQRHPALIPIIIGVGLLLGLVARRLPAWVVARSSVESRRAELTAQLAGLLARYDHPPLREVVGQHAAAIGTKRVGTAELTSRLDAAVTDVNQAVTDVDAAISPLAQELRTLQPPLLVRWELPHEADEIARDARALLADGHRQAERGDVAGLEATVATLREALDRLGPDPLDAPAVARERIATVMAGAAEVLESRKDGVRLGYLFRMATNLAALCRTPDQADATVTDRLRLLHDIHHYMESFTDELAVLVHELRIHPEVAAGNEARLRTAVDRLEEVVIAADVDARLVDLVASLEAVVGLIDSTLGDTVDPTVSPPAAPPVAPSPKVAASAWTAPASVRLAAVRQVRRWTSFGLVVGAFRYVVLGALLVAVSYRWFADGWVGTLADMSTVLVWAFGVDVTAELVTQVARQSPVGGGAAETGIEEPEVTPVPLQPVEEAVEDAEPDVGEATPLPVDEGEDPEPEPEPVEDDIVVPESGDDDVVVLPEKDPVV